MLKSPHEQSLFAPTVLNRHFAKNLTVGLTNILELKFHIGISTGP